METVRGIGIYVCCLIASIAVHEYSHALAAHRLGDRTPESQGRLTLNPVAHADPVGTLLLPVLAALFRLPLFGWGRPVETQPSNYTRKYSMRTGMAIVAIAGPLSNLVLALGVTLIASIMSRVGVLNAATLEVVIIFITLNLVLMIFNLLPLHPLDGGKVLAFLLPTRAEWIDEWSQQYGWTVLLALLILGGPIFQRMLWPAGWLTSWLINNIVLG